MTQSVQPQLVEVFMEVFMVHGPSPDPDLEQPDPHGIPPSAHQVLMI